MVRDDVALLCLLVAGCWLLVGSVGLSLSSASESRLRRCFECVSETAGEHQ